MSRFRETRAYHWLEENPATGTLVGVGLGAVAIFLVVSLGLYSKETFVTKTACTRDPSSPSCAKLREAVARAEPIRNSCIGYQRVTQTRGRACPKDYIHLNRHKRKSALGGDASQPAHTAGQQPEPGREPGGKQPKGKPPKQHSAAPASTPQTAAAEQAEPSTSPLPTEEPGASDETPAAENSNGVKTCVDLVVSACADVGLKTQLP